jgi:hypothetical protein
MRISFDLDETLIINPVKISAEPELNIPYRWFYCERLRLGAPELMQRINKNGIELWIYTTSFRPVKYIKKYFKHYGVKIDRVINGQVHQNEVQRDFNEVLPSKMPGRYRIDLHVDDEIQVKQYGSMYGFKVFLLKEENKAWVDELWDVICKLNN